MYADTLPRRVFGTSALLLTKDSCLLICHFRIITYYAGAVVFTVDAKDNISWWGLLPGWFSSLSRIRILCPSFGLQFILWNRERGIWWLVEYQIFLYQDSRLQPLALPWMPTGTVAVSLLGEVTISGTYTCSGPVGYYIWGDVYLAQVIGRFNKVEGYGDLEIFYI